MLFNLCIGCSMSVISVYLSLCLTVVFLFSFLIVNDVGVFLLLLFRCVIYSVVMFYFQCYIYIQRFMFVFMCMLFNLLIGY